MGERGLSFGWCEGPLAVLRALRGDATYIPAAVAAECVLHAVLRSRYYGAKPALLLHARLRELVRGFPRAFPRVPRLRRRARARRA